jgi:hypothetical protein
MVSRLRWFSGTLSITGQFSSLRVGESLRIGMLSSPSTSGKTYEDPCPIQTRRDKRIESESHAWARIGEDLIHLLAIHNYILFVLVLEFH